MSDIWVDLYARVSTDLQAEEGYSLQEQASRLQLYAQAQGWRVYQTYMDGGFSGAKMDRPGLQNMIEDVRAHRVQKVVVYKLDRLSRSQKDTLYLIEDVLLANGVDFVSLTESLDTSSPLGKAMIGILAVFAQLEREEIAERMMMGRIASAKEGNWRGGSGVPIGYRYTPRTATEDGHLDVDPYEAELVREVFRLFLEGLTFHAIYDRMRKSGHSTSYGSFAGGGSQLIPAMLANRAYIGEIKYQGKWYPGKHDPIIDPETFRRAQARLAEYRATLDDNKRKPFQGRRQLTGLIWCGECGARWCHTFSNYKTKSGEYRRYEFYKCYTRAHNSRMKTAESCTMPSIPAEELETAVWDQVEALTFEAPGRPGRDRSQAEAYQSKLADLDKQLERLVHLYSLGSVPFETVAQRSEELQDERERLHEAIKALDTGDSKLTAEEVQTAVAKASAIRADGTEEQKRELLTMLIDRITVNRDGIVIEWNF